jgi:hypothetical protein
MALMAVKVYKAVSLQKHLTVEGKIRRKNCERFVGEKCGRL